MEITHATADIAPERSTNLGKALPSNLAPKPSSSARISSRKKQYCKPTRCKRSILLSSTSPLQHAISSRIQPKANKNSNKKRPLILYNLIYPYYYGVCLSLYLSFSLSIIKNFRKSIPIIQITYFILS